MPVINDKFKSLYWTLPVVIALTLIFAACQRTEQPSDQPEIARTGDATPTPSPNPAEAEERPAIIAFGDSLTAGFGLTEEQSYTTLLQRRLDEKGYPYRVINAGVSGDTSAGGARRIDWALQGNAKFLILELGANDALRGQPVPELKKNLAQIIERAQSRGLTVILAGMEAPPNMGQEYSQAFRQAYADLAKQYKLVFIPFVLEGVGGVSELNQADGIHPNPEGEKLMMENVWRVLEPLLQKQD
jgi:acyl-CoA thioesterase-1